MTDETEDAYDGFMDDIMTKRAVSTIAALIEQNAARADMLTMGGQVVLMRERGEALSASLFEASRCATIAGLRSRIEFLSSVSSGYRKYGFDAVLAALKEF